MNDHQKTRLTLFNDKWVQRERLFARHAPLPFWAPGLILTDAIRSVYEHFLPVAEYAWDLASVLSDVLPGTFKNDAFSKEGYTKHIFNWVADKMLHLDNDICEFSYTGSPKAVVMTDTELKAYAREVISSAG